MSAPAPPAGWYPTPEGNQRYWDGNQWSEQVAPVPATRTAPAGAGTGGQPIRPTALDSPHPGMARRLGWGGLAVAALLGVASSGVSGLFGLSATYVLVVAVVALVRGHVDWALLRSRPAGGAAVAAAFALVAVAATTAATTNPTPS